MYCLRLVHREEGNRIIREFLIGEHNIEHTTRGLKSEKYSDPFVLLFCFYIHDL